MLEFSLVAQRKQRAPPKRKVAGSTPAEGTSPVSWPNGKAAPCKGAIVGSTPTETSMESWANSKPAVLKTAEGR